MRQLKRIVVGHDLKSGGETALKSAVILAGRCDAALRLVYVVEPQHLIVTNETKSLDAFIQLAGGDVNKSN
jgi:nucleotide-binding universal stress UspA family protein